MSEINASIDQRFGAFYHLHVQGLRRIQPKKQYEKVPSKRRLTLNGLQDVIIQG
jgi:hypothetical protein